ncbi:MAG: Glutamate racemase [Candidatus Woesebacteria bacterium GW2011_GWC2_45_9]|uniref:Glutamate racemase n=1 Tax=Candidatus Woesebacteria bacterium GW2011_GWC2_45_9 TaxID=1618589 RepID=A0A0G1QID6_9BACT|nr:MAG: Glutamate racemase [Candidatus Woesebacteria bacterium GW2011_GWC2_45_9]
MDKRAIGVFDSGLGGLTVVKEIRKILPHENIIYLGDTARIPYGTRSKETVTRFSFEDAAFLLKENIKCLVVACNTASALAGDSLKKKIKIPIFDVVAPAAKGAAGISRNKRIGVIGIKGTIFSQAYLKQILKSLPTAKVFQKACPLFVPLIEEGEIHGPIIAGALRKYLAYFRDKKIDTLILGCTHYPIIKGLIKRRLGQKVKLLNPGESVAQEVKGYLTKKNILNPEKGKGGVEYYVTDLTESFTNVAEMFLGEKMEGKIKKVSL